MKNENSNPHGLDPEILSLFDTVHIYTRAQAVADGVQIEVTKTAQEAGIKFPVFITRSVFETYVAVPEGVAGQDEAGRLGTLCRVLNYAELMELFLRKLSESPLLRPFYSA